MPTVRRGPFVRSVLAGAAAKETAALDASAVANTGVPGNRIFV